MDTATQPIQQPMQQVAQQPVQQAQATQAQPMPQPSVSSTPEHSHFGLYTVIALLVGATAILGGIVIVMTTGKSQSIQQPSSQVMQTQQPATQSASVASQMQQVTPEPIASKQSLDTAMQTLNGTDMMQINAGLAQNSQDTSSFSQ